MKKTLFIASLAFAAFTSLASAADILVNTTATGTPDGLTTETAYTSIVDAINAANEGDRILVDTGTYDVTAQLNLNEAISIVGQGTVTIKAVSDYGTTNGTKHMLIAFVGTESAPVELSNITFDCDTKCYGLQAYGNAYLTLNNVTISNSKGAGLTVNGSTVVATNLTTNGNTWGAVNVDPGSGVTTPSVFTFNSGSLTESNDIWSDGSNVNGSATVTVTASGYTEYLIGGTANGKLWANTLAGKVSIVRDATTVVFSTLQSAFTAATSSETIRVHGTTTVTSTLAINKPITIKGVDTGAISTSGSNNVFLSTSGNVTIEDLDIEKTDNTDQQLIAIQSGNDISVKNNKIHGKFVIGGGETTRAMVVSAGLTGLTIEGNTIYSLRQPAYISGTTTGNVTNNFVYNTKGWVLENGDLTFSGNTWGTSTQANVFDIAIIPSVAANFYTDIVSMANANNDAVIEDQRMSPRKLSVVYVESGANHSTDLGGRYHPYGNLTDADARLVTGGKLVVSGFSALPTTATTTTTGVETTVNSATELSVNTTAGTVTADIPAGTTISGPSTWDGTFDLPVAVVSPALPYELAGSWLTTVGAVELGAGDTPLTFSQAIKLTFAGQANKKAGWTRNGVFTEITTTCPSDVSTLASGADCKTNEGADLVIWTKHATTFIAYTEAAIPYGGGGGSVSASTGSVGSVLGVSTSTVATTNPEIIVTIASSTVPGQVLGATAFNFTRNLGYGVTGDDVTELQKLLIAEGYLMIKTPTKWFGPLTKAALTKWQAKNSIPSTGFFGTISRAHLVK